MATVEQGFLQAQLQERRERLQEAIHVSPREGTLLKLLSEVDRALEQISNGTYGLCETCQEPIEQERLLADPLVRYCLGHLTAEEQRALEADLELAARIQRGLLPQQDLRWAGWEVHYHYAPAGLVSGDYCDLIPPEDGSGDLVFIVGDVSGKGVAASLLMTQLHAMFRSLASVGLALDQVVARASRVFCESALTGQYATLVCGRAGRGGEVELCNAGHLPVLLARTRGVERMESGGVPLGMFSSGQYAFRKARLEPGESLFLYTDGFTESRDHSQQEYGIERLARFLGERNRLAAGELTAACLDDLRKFSADAPKLDDLTVMVLRRAG